MGTRRRQACSQGLARSSREKIGRATLGNGTASTVRKLLERKGLLKYVRHVLSIEEVKHWKPHCEPYLFAARSDTGRAQSPRSPRSGRLGHARRSQLVTGWISVLEKRYQPAIRPSRRERDSLDEVVAALVSGR